MVNQEYLKLGQKIRNFRIRSGKSQMELELEIGASAGSLSRIENGEVNPTKETLLRIVDGLKLVSFEAGTLFGIDMSDSLSNLFNTSKEILEINDIVQVVQKAVDSITYELNLLGSFVVLKKGDFIQLQTFAKSWYSDMAMKVINTPLLEVKAPITLDSKNLMVKAILDQKVYYSENLEDFVVPAVNRTTSKILEKVTGVRSSIVIPLIFNNESIGAMHFSKSYLDDFKNELPFLKSFTEYLANILFKIYKND
ncbi:MAG: helix-turn-helix domain-containing protein [Candidatus Dojkabacteria bacterium]